MKEHQRCLPLIFTIKPGDKATFSLEQLLKIIIKKLNLLKMKKFKNIVLTLVAMVISATAINAKSIDPVNSVKTAEPFTVKYVGNDGDYLLFQVIVNSNNTKETSFAVSDKQEGEIYSAYIESTYKAQTLKIEKRENQELDFKLVIGKEVYSRSFAILSTVAMEEVK